MLLVVNFFFLLQSNTGSFLIIEGHWFTLVAVRLSNFSLIDSAALA